MNRIDRAVAAFKAANPVPDPWALVSEPASVRNLTVIEERSRDMVTHIRDPRQGEHGRRLRRGTWLAAAAAVAALVLVGSVVLLSIDREPRDPLANAIALGTAVIADHGAGDIAGALARFAPDAEISVDSATDISSMRSVYEFQVAIGTEKRVSDCAAAQAAAPNGMVNVSCALHVTDALYRTGDIVIPGRLIYTVDDGEIVAWYEQFGAQTLWVPYYTEFREWATENHPDEASRMFTDEGGPIFSTESGRVMASLVEQFSDGRP